MEHSIYLSGPMCGQPAFNFPAFYAAEAALQAMGWDVWNPARMDEEDPELDLAAVQANPGDYRAQLMRRDTRGVADCSDIAMLPSWQKSRGSVYELLVALECGLQTWEYVQGSLVKVGFTFRAVAALLFKNYTERKL